MFFKYKQNVIFVWSEFRPNTFNYLTYLKHGEYIIIIITTTIIIMNDVILLNFQLPYTIYIV